MLEILGFDKDDCKKLITQDFVKLMYITMEKVPHVANEEKFYFAWGERAEIDFTKREILDFASKVYNQLICLPIY